MSNLLTNSVHALVARFAAWRARQRAYAELSSLDDRDLADMGISRSEIPYILSKTLDEQPVYRATVTKGHDYLHAA